jgi:hypothetical protein
MDEVHATARHSSSESAVPLVAGTRGTVRFARTDERDAACRSLERAGLIVVELEGIGPSVRGRLGETIDLAIERELGARGMVGRGLANSELAGAPATSDDALSDQLHRARRGGARGIAIVLGPLRAATGPLGAIEPQDCAALRLLARATEERPVFLLLDDRDARTGGYAEPMALEQILSGERAKVVVASRVPSPDVSPEAPSEAPPVAGAAVCESATPTPVVRAAATDRDEPWRTPPVAPVVRAAATDRDEPWRTWTLQLTAARGPQPLAALEKLFADSYVPLNGAIASGLDDPRARSAHDEFRNTFIKSYTDAFATFAATTKRPRMVLDVHDLANRIARLHGARSTRWLLVDGMRWDLSRLVAERVTARLGSRAVLADDLLLWSALPTTTMRQLETIARGVEALRVPDELEPDAEPPRGRTAEYIRRLRVGPREIHKLDLVESRLGAARGAVMRALPEIADATADVVARHAESLAPHTLLFVFGDHGFAIDRSGTAHQGGASPEEVLVGSFALLVGDVH